MLPYSRRARVHLSAKTSSTLRRLDPRCALPSLGTGRMFVFCSVTSYPRRLTATRRCPMPHDGGRTLTHTLRHPLTTRRKRPATVPTVEEAKSRRHWVESRGKPQGAVRLCTISFGSTRGGAFRTGASQPTGCWSSGASSCSRGGPAGPDANLSQRRTGVTPKANLAYGKASARVSPERRASREGRMRDYAPPADN